MKCQELTQFINEVFKSRDLIDQPRIGRVADTLLLREEIEDLAVLLPRNIGLRLELSREFELSSAGDFYDGWALVRRKTGKLAYINREGRYLRNDWTRLEFQDADRFSEGIAVVTSDGNKIRFLKTDGHFLPGEFHNMFNLSHFRFSQGYGLALIDPSSLVTRYIDKEGNTDLFLNTVTDESAPFSREGLAIYSHRDVNVKQSTGGFFRTDGTVLELEDGPETTEYFGEFSEGFAWVKVATDSNQKVWRIIDTKGHYQRNKNGVIAQLFAAGELTPSSFKNGWSKAYHPPTERYQFFNNTCERLVDEFRNNLFTHASDFSEGYAVVDFKGKQAFLGRDGKYLRDKKGQIAQFVFAESFDEGLAWVELEKGESVLIDHKCNQRKFGRIENR